ncbi:hypothetical protein [Williamsia sp.]|uniref:hypothetical protein n=1 Tax=Williamsia sp. TaxID=1872085 RepID=UPI002F93A999
MDINEVTDELYGLEPADFVEIRTARAKEARSDGDRALANKIAALRRPTTVAWMVNILARERAEDVTNLLELGEAMRDAQRHLAGDDLRTLTTQRQHVVRAMAKQAGALAADHGYQASETALREVGQSLHAALADPEIGELVRAGRLLSAVSYSGMGPAGLTLVGGSEQKRARSRATREEVSEEALNEARSQLVDAEEAQREAESTARTAQDDADRAASTLSDAAARVDDLREQLTQAEQELQFARRAEQAATGQVATSDRELEHVRARVQKIRTRLETLAAD